MNIRASFSKMKLRLHEFVQKHPRLAMVLAVISLVIAGVLITLALMYQKPEPKVIPKPAPKPEPKVVYYSRLTGKEVKTKADETAPVTAIMIENSLAARPQSGLKDAGIVYEAIAEGGITRFLALYQNDKPRQVGPVRSLRTYFVDWLAPYQASVAHVGGSAQSLREIRNGKYRDIDQFFNADTYWRAADRYAPHNVYTNFKRLDALNKAKGYVSSDFNGLERTDNKPLEEIKASKITITFSGGPDYNTSYSYQRTCDCYTRTLGGVAHEDREEGQITPNVVIGMQVDMRQVMEDGYRESITTTGTGSAKIFQNGNITEASWRKTSRGSQLEFLDRNGKPFKFERGQVWIAAVPNGQGKITWKK